MHARVRHRQELVSALTLAVERDEIDVHYQPIVDLATGRHGRGRGARPLGSTRPRPALTRTSSSRSPRRPASWSQIGRNVLREACSPGRVLAQRRSRAWRTCASTSTSLPSSSWRDDLVDERRRDPRADGPSRRDRLVLEITESGVMENPDDALAHDEGAPGARRLARPRRLRHRALVTRAPARVPDRHAQDRAGVRRRPARQPRRHAPSSRRSSGSAARWGTTSSPRASSPPSKRRRSPSSAARSHRATTSVTRWLRSGLTYAFSSSRRTDAMLRVA